MRKGQIKHMLRPRLLLIDSGQFLTVLLWCSSVNRNSPFVKIIQEKTEKASCLLRFLLYLVFFSFAFKTDIIHSVCISAFLTKFSLNANEILKENFAHYPKDNGNIFALSYENPLAVFYFHCSIADIIQLPSPLYK